MIPILYEASETTFTSQGLGRLFDAISCIVKEERNGKYELEMIYPVNGRHFKDIKYNRIILAKPNQTSRTQPFRIYKITKPLKKQCKIYAEHTSYQLSFIPVAAFTATSFSDAMIKIPLNAMEYCPFTFWTDKQTSGNYSVIQPTSLRAILGGSENSLLDVYGTAEYEFDRYTVKAWLNRGSDRGVKLLYGKNITDLQQEENIEKVVTGIAPFWKSGEDDTVVTLPEGVIYCANHALFPYERTIPYDFTESFDTEPTEAQLRAKAQQYVDANLTGTPEVNITLSYINLYESEEYKWLTGFDTVSLCDTITVDFELLDVQATAKVITTEYDVLKERYSKIEVGDAKTTLAKQVVGITEGISEEFDRKTSYLRDYAYEQTQMISGANGGNVKFKYNGSNQPSGIKFMSGTDEATAQYQILINYAGIGFSTDYGQTFTNAWTIDGRLSASWITTGTMSANRIYAGVLSDVSGNNSFDLDAGTLTITKGSIHLGTYDATNQRYPFSVDSSGALVAVSATLVNASLSGTVTTESGLFKSSLSAGQLAMYYDSTLYGQFSGGAWSANQTKRGIGLYMSENASYMFFGRYNSASSGYQAAYVINYGLDKNTDPPEIGYAERHIFYGTMRAVNAVYLSSTLDVQGRADFNGTIYTSVLNASSGINCNGLLAFPNNVGVSFKDILGNSRTSLIINSDNDFMVGNTTTRTWVTGMRVDIGRPNAPTYIHGSNIFMLSCFQSGSFSVTIKNSWETGHVNFSSLETFNYNPQISLSLLYNGTQTVQMFVTSRDVYGFSYKIKGSSSTAESATLMWVAQTIG